MLLLVRESLIAAASFIVAMASWPFGKSELNQWLVAKRQIRARNRMSINREVLRIWARPFNLLDCTLLF